MSGLKARGADTAETIVRRLLDQFDDLSPELRKAAKYVAENTVDVGLGSIRQLADAADVKPNTLVRLAQAAGYETFEGFRAPFRAELTAERPSFPDRARWLDRLGRSGHHGRVLAEMAGSALGNVEATFLDTDAGRLRAAARALMAARRTHVLGIGVANPLAYTFSYLSRMFLDTVLRIPRDGRLPIDDVAMAGPDDALLAISFMPYRTETIQAVQVARQTGMTIVGLSDRAASPLIRLADHGFIVPTDTPQIFSSIAAATALIETLVAFMVAEAGPAAADRIAAFDARRREIGVYWPEGE